MSQCPVCWGATFRNSRPPESGDDGSRINGGGFIWASEGVLSHSPMPLPNPLLGDIIEALPPPYPNHHFRSPKKFGHKSSAPAAEGGIVAQQVPSLAVSQAFEVAILTHMTPLCLNVGGVKRVYNKGLYISWVAICNHVCWDHLGVTLVCASCAQTFLSSDALRCHKKMHTSE